MRKVAKSRPQDNGQAGDAEQLKEAVESPGVAEIPEAEVRAGPAQVTEIPEHNLDPDADDGGEPLPQDPALMTVPLSRPGPHSWVRIFPERYLRTALLAYKPARDASPEYHYAAPELQKGLRQDLKQVRVWLVFDASGAGEAFLWIVPETSFSPYHNAIAKVIARGPAFVESHLFRFAKVELKKRDVDVRTRLASPDDPVPVLPSRPIGKLLPEALGPEKIITSASHPVYVSLMSGGRLK